MRHYHDENKTVAGDYQQTSNYTWYFIYFFNFLMLIFYNISSYSA